MLTILDRYVLRQVSVPLAAGLIIGLLLLLADRMVRLLDTTLGKKSSFLSAFELMAYLVPHYLGTAVPGALFLGLLLGFNKLSKNNELDAMLASGVGLHRLARPVVMLAVLFSLFSLAMFGWLQPYTRYAYRSVLYDIVSIDAFFLAEEGVFMQAGSRTFILDKLDRDTNKFERIFLFDYKGPSGSETMTAERGELIPVPGQTRPVLRLENGTQLTLDRWPTLAPAATPVMPQVGTFESSETPLGKVSKDLFRPRGNDEREMTIVEIYQQMDTPPSGATTNSLRSEFHRRLVNIVAMLLLPFLALPFAVGRARSPRAYRIVIAVVLIVAFNEIIGQGALLTKRGGFSPYLSMWLPTFLLATFSFWRFYKTCFSIESDGMDRVIAPVQELLGSWWKRLSRLWQKQEAAS
ncbi:MAG: LptF/LptG family permease [Proteobacteria bacterium]|nr:LptF/LptG family permease [Pseudomonadota bacterium]